MSALAWLMACWLPAALFLAYAVAEARNDVTHRSRKGLLWRVADRDGRRLTLAQGFAPVAFVAGLVPLMLDHFIEFAGIGLLALAALALRPPKMRGRRPVVRYEPVVTGDGREQIVYALGGFDHFAGVLESVKFGHTVRGESVRSIEVAQREQQVRVRVLAIGAGGEEREDELLDALARWRYPTAQGGRSEWFHPAPEVLAAVAELERPTKLGRRVLESRTRKVA